MRGTDACTDRDAERAKLAELQALLGDLPRVHLSPGWASRKKSRDRRHPQENAVLKAWPCQGPPTLADDSGGGRRWAARRRAVGPLGRPHALIWRARCCSSARGGAAGSGAQFRCGGHRRHRRRALHDRGILRGRIIDTPCATALATIRSFHPGAGANAGRAGAREEEPHQPPGTRSAARPILAGLLPRRP